MPHMKTQMIRTEEGESLMPEFLSVKRLDRSAIIFAGAVFSAVWASFATSVLSEARRC